MDPSGSPHWGAPFTEEPLLSTEERPLHRGAPTPARRSQAAAFQRPRPLPPSCRSPPASSGSSCFTSLAPLLIPHTGGAWEPLVSHQPLCLPTLRQPPSHSSPEPWGKRASWLSAAIAGPLPTVLTLHQTGKQEEMLKHKGCQQEYVCTHLHTHITQTHSHNTHIHIPHHTHTHHTHIHTLKAFFPGVLKSTTAIPVEPDKIAWRE